MVSCLHDGVGLQAEASKSWSRGRHPNWRPPDTTADYHKMIRWLGSGHASSDVHVDDLWLRSKALSDRGNWGLVGDQRNRRAVVQEKVQFPRKAKGYHVVVPTAEVVVSLQDKVNKLKKKASAHQLFKTGTEYPAE
jgi:hypothetical protein